MNQLKIFFLIVLLSLLVACAGTTPPLSLTGEPLTPLVSIDPSGVFAAGHSGETVIYALGGLRYRFLEGEDRLLSDEPPLFLAWSPDDTRFAAVFDLPDAECRLSLYASDGLLLQSWDLPTKVTALAWSARGDLLASGYRLASYSFGGNLQQTLFRVTDGQLFEARLTDTTLNPNTVKLLNPVLAEMLPVLFSRQGDELVYVSLHDPPEFPPFVKVLYRNWQTSEVRELLKLPLQKIHLGQGARADSIIVASGKSRYSIDLWPAQSGEETSFYQFIDSKLYCQNEIIADWGQGARLQLLDDGRFFLARKGKLYMGRGLQPALSSGYSEKNWELRRWRFDGLISPEEYLQLSHEVKQ